ncbi:platelet factor 4-like isoform X1 [Phyllostomus discolor]|uniref:Multifunctional fusion protein n=1 Tax=Phyllostomus discolor TaxID=89673 RepID=A0A7E6DFT1_9CHIR|nr:platelet factor 4-like isoform X1 [Phyllostomus discolor]
MDTRDKTGLESLRSTALHNAGSDCPRTLVSGWHLGNMSLRMGSCAFPIPGLLLLGLLLLPAVVARTSAEPEEGEGDLQCMCVNTTSRVHPKHIISLEVIRAGPHCPTSQMIATLKKGKKICLDPHAPIYRRIIQKLAGSKPLAD